LAKLHENINSSIQSENIEKVEGVIFWFTHFRFKIPLQNIYILLITSVRISIASATFHLVSSTQAYFVYKISYRLRRAPLIRLRRMALYKSVLIDW